MSAYSPILKFTQRCLVGVGLVALVYSGGVATYGAVYQWYESRRFDQAVAEHGGIKSGLLEEMTDLHEGDVVGRLEVSRLGISLMVLQGIEEQTLLTGAGHVPGTSMPGLEGNVVIAAHRDTFFRRLKGILPGDRVEMVTFRGTYRYIVDSVEIVNPEDTKVMESRAARELTLITCYPFRFVGDAPDRFIVHAKLGT